MLGACSLDAVIVLSTHAHPGIRRNPWESAVSRAGGSARNTDCVTSNSLNLRDVFSEHRLVPNRWQVSQEGDGRSCRRPGTTGHPRHRMAGPTARCVACENKAAPRSRMPISCSINDGEIATREPGGLEPPRRLSGRRRGHARGQQCETCCRGVRRQRRHEARRCCIGQCPNDRRWSRPSWRAKCIGP